MLPKTPVERAILENMIGMFAICSDCEGSFDYWIAGLYKGGDVPEGLKLFTCPESTRATFSGKGPLADSMQELNTRIWNEWYPTEGKRLGANAGLMLEIYSAGDMKKPDYTFGISMPVREAGNLHIGLN